MNTCVVYASLVFGKSLIRAFDYIIRLVLQGADIDSVQINLDTPCDTVGATKNAS